MGSPGRHQDAPDASPRGAAGGLGRRIGPVVGALAAAAISAGLVFWISTADENPVSGAQGAPEPQARVYAPRKPDADQVIRAFEQMQEIYADQGLSGVAAFNRSCAESVRADSTLLDFCLAFDIYAAALGGEGAPSSALQAEAQPRELALAQSAVAPGTDAAARLAAVRALARQASLASTAGESPAPASEPLSGETPSSNQRAAADNSKPAGQAEVGRVAAKPAKAKAKAKAGTKGAASCRSRATPAQRAVCASPSLRTADARMRKAYRQALAAGADQRRLSREQARWRTTLNNAAPSRSAMARLYQKRTRQLEATTRRLRASSG